MNNTGPRSQAGPFALVRQGSDGLLGLPQDLAEPDRLPEAPLWT